MGEQLGKKPLHIFRGDLSGRWYATNQYAETEHGGFAARKKEDITEQIDALVEWEILRREGKELIGKSVVADDQ